jgi:rare lipoprotein A
MKWVVVRINDRGVLAKERVIDLSAAAAKKLGMLRAGLAPVKLEILQSPRNAHSAPQLKPSAQLRHESWSHLK